MRRFLGFSFFPLISFLDIPSFKFLEFSRGVKIVLQRWSTILCIISSITSGWPKTFINTSFTCTYKGAAFQETSVKVICPILSASLCENSSETRAAIALTYCWTLFFTMRSLKKEFARWVCWSKRTSQHVLE